MNYQLTIALKQRKCSMCPAKIVKGTKLFVMTDWPRNQDYPTKKNVCLNCAAKLTDIEFVSFLRLLLKELEGLAVIQNAAAKQPDTKAKYKCDVPDCNGEVTYEEKFRMFRCQGTCGYIYSLQETETLSQA